MSSISPGPYCCGQKLDFIIDPYDFDTVYACRVCKQRYKKSPVGLIPYVRFVPIAGEQRVIERINASLYRRYHKLLRWTMKR